MCNEPFGSKSVRVVLRDNRPAFLIVCTETEIGVCADSVPSSLSRDVDYLLLILIRSTHAIFRIIRHRI